MEPVSLDITQPEDNAVSLPVQGATEQSPSIDIAKERTNKTQFGLGDVLKKDSNSIYQDFVDGKENLIRTQAATTLDYQKAMGRQQAIQDLATKQQGPLDANQVMRIMDPFSPSNIKTDPASVIERAYATKYVSSMNTASGYMSDTNPLLEAQREVPKQTDDTIDLAGDVFTKNQYILKRIQDTQQNLVGEQSWPGWLADQTKQLFQPYIEYKERGLVDNLNFAGVGLGSNTEEQSSALYGKNFPEFKASFDKAMDYLEKNNPSLAVAWGQKMLGQDTFEKILDNTFTAMAIPDIATGAKGIASIAKKVTSYNRIRKAANDIVVAGTRDPSANPVNMAAGAGDLSTAATRSVSGDVVNAINGTSDPLKVGRDALLTTWKDDADKFAANPGTFLSREATVRLHDEIVKDGEDLLNRIETMNRVERQPLAVTSQNVIKAYQDKIRGDFKGPPGMLLDIDGPVREEASGTYWYKLHLGDHDGSQFSSAETAAGRAESIGLHPTIEGTEPEKVYLPQTAVFKNEYTDVITPKPVNGATGKGTGKKGSPKTVRNEYTPGENKLAFRNIETQHTEKGTKFISEDGVEILPSTRPSPGMVPYNLKTHKFEAPLTQEQTRVEQQGLGFHIVHWLPMKETDDVLRDLMIKTTSGEAVPEAISTSSASGINSIKNSLLGWVRNSEDTLSINESAQRKAATYTQSNVQQWAKQMNKDLEDIKNGITRYDPVTGEDISRLVSYPKSFLGKLIPGKKVFEQFERTLDASRRIKDPGTGEEGYFFKSAGELQDFYNTNFKRDPSYLETKAYFNYVKIKEGERMMAEISEFRNRARLGAEQHQISMVDAQGKTTKSGFFDGIDNKVFPGGDDYILVMGDVQGGEDLHKLGHINTDQLNELKRQVTTGEAKVIRIYDMNHQPLDNFSPVANNKLVRYVFAKNIETKPLEFNHVERRGGAHFDWDYDHYLKQADMRPHAINKGVNAPLKFEHLYVGDKTIMPIKNKRLGENVAKLFNEAHDHINNNQWDLAKPIAAKLGIEWKEFTGWYHPGRDAEGRPTPPRLNSREPVVVVSRNKSIKDIDSSLEERYKGTFKDATKTGEANNFKVAYNTERRSYDGMSTINDVGTKGNPIYAHQPADFVDPITTMNRSLNRAINSVFMDDYKLYAVEHWLREAEPYLIPTKEQVRSSPFWHFNNAEFRKDASIDKVLNLKSNRYKINSFVGIPSKFDNWVHNFTQHLADNAYEKFGPEANRTFSQKAVSIPPIWMLHHITNPVDFIRGVTFNFKLGFFSPAQFLVQAQTHSLIWALEPKHGTVGTYHMMLHGWSRVNKDPAILSALDKYATKLNMFGSKARPGEWLEAMHELDNTGFEHVAGEYANLSKAYLPTTNFVQNDINKGLRIGQTPFRLGEQSTRVTAWYTAFRKFREANPTTPITNIERGKILNHADLLTVNMSRASNSMLNHGVFSLSTQFLSYQIKLAELFWSKRIGETATERSMARARIVLGFGLLYGIPNAVGVTGAPFSDNLREHFMDDLGYIPGEKWLSTFINEGFPTWMYAMITGNGDLQAGMVPNVGDRFGSQGWNNIKQGLRSNIPWWQAIGGAGVSTMSNFTSSLLDPFYQGALSWARGDTKDERFTIRGADLVEPWKQISTVSTAAKWWTAMQTGKWFSTNESYITDVSPFNATMLALTGMSPQEQDDMFITNQMLKGETEAQKEALKEFIKDWRRGIQAKQDGDTEQGNAYHRNAMARLTTVGYPYEKMLSAIAIANKGYESAIHSSAYKDWSTGDRNKQEQRLERYKRQLDLDDKRRQ